MESPGTRISREPAPVELRSWSAVFEHLDVWTDHLCARIDMLLDQRGFTVREESVDEHRAA